MMKKTKIYFKLAKITTVTYDVCLSIASRSSLKQRRIEQSLIVFFKSFRVQGSSYILNFVIPMVINCYLWCSGINVLQPSCNNLFRHNTYSFSYVIEHIWNSLRSSTKSSNLGQYSACKCKKCILYSIARCYSFCRIFILVCHGFFFYLVDFLY